MLMLYAYRAPPEIARPAIRCPVYSLHRARSAMFAIPQQPASQPASHARNNPHLWCGLIPAFVSDKRTEGTASRTILLHPSRFALLTVRP